MKIPFLSTCLKNQENKDTRKRYDGIDLEFMKVVEGVKKEFYVPKNNKGVPLGKSGVTVGPGYDLGQRSKEDTEVKNLKKKAPRLYERMEPFIGLTKYDADNALREIKPDPLTEEELDILIKHSIETYHNLLTSVFIPSEVWNEMDEGIRTVVFSVMYQYGNLTKRTPKFYQYVMGRDYVGMIEELSAFGDDYPTRRRLEVMYALCYSKDTQRQITQSRFTHYKGV